MKDPYRRRLANKREHTEIAENALGKKLPDGACVHHADMNKTNNAQENLVICPDHAYHKLLHRRTDAFNACGNANWVKCCHCKQYDDPVSLTVTNRKVNGIVVPLSYHKSCNTKNHRDWMNKQVR